MTLVNRNSFILIQLMDGGNRVVWVGVYPVHTVFISSGFPVIFLFKGDPFCHFLI